MRKIFALLLLVCMYTSAGFSASVPTEKLNPPIKDLVYKTNPPTMKYAFVFDGKSDKNEEVLKYFKDAIIKSNTSDFKAVFPENLVYTADWSEKGVKSATDKAMASDASVVVSLGYLSTKYLNNVNDKKKFVITIDQYGLREFGDTVFNPATQAGKGMKVFHLLTHFNKAAVLINESYYNDGKDWDKYLKDNFTDAQAELIPVNGDIDAVINKISNGGYDAVMFTPLFNLSNEQRTKLITFVNNKKMVSYSTMGKEDVEKGVLLGTSALDIDKKLADATSFSISNALKGEVKKTDSIKFYEDELLYYNKDTGESINYEPHLRVLKHAEIISNVPPKVFSLTEVFSALETQNIDIERKKLLLKAARASSTSAMLRYLPTFGVTLGFQRYDGDYADTVKLSMPEKTGIFKMTLDQVIYSPALVTNILIKRKQVNFAAAEKYLTEQNMGIEIALLYIETLMLENMIKVQKEYVKEARENLAIARVREKMGFCGNEESLRWATLLTTGEQHLLEMNAEYSNLKILVNKLLAQDQKTDFSFQPLKSTDPAFYTKDLHVIDYVCTPSSLEQFTELLVEEAYRVAPELAKLRAATKMKDYELRMYIQKFFLPDAKVTLEYSNLINPEYAGDVKIMQPLGPGGSHVPVSMGHPRSTSMRLGVFAQWTPIEGGSKFAEIARVKAERQELQRYTDEVKHSMEAHVRETINKAVSAYFSIEKFHKAMSASNESYYKIKDKYLHDEASMAQVLDSQKAYMDAKAGALNSQYVFFKELVWVQRAIGSVNWATAPKDAQDFIFGLKEKLGEHKDIKLNL